MITEIKMPVLGLTMEEGIIVEWVKSEGERVEADETLLVVETDKAASDVPSPASGILARIVAAPGDTVPVHQVIAYLAKNEADLDAVSALTPAAAAPAPEACADAAPPPTPFDPPPRLATPAAPHPAAVPCGDVPGLSINASPRARATARRLGIELACVPPRGGRIVEEDVIRAAADGTPSRQGARVTPLAARLAAELGIDVAKIRASPDIRIRAADLLAAVAELEAQGATLAAAGGPATPAAASVSATRPPLSFATGDIRPLNRYRRVTAKRMAESWAAAPQVTYTSRCDMTQAIGLRNELKEEASARGVKLSYDAMFVRAVATALLEFPEAGARWVEGQGIALSAEVNVGVAVDLAGEGLIVPVVRNAQKRGLLDIAGEIERLAARAREGRLGPDDYKGGTFTITNLGLLGVETFTPIINLPEVAILGVGAIIPTPTYVEGEVVPRQLCTLSLVADHRVVDGAPAARVLSRIRQMMEHPYFLLEWGL